MMIHARCPFLDWSFGLLPQSSNSSNPKMPVVGLIANHIGTETPFFPLEAAHTVILADIATKVDNSAVLTSARIRNIRSVSVERWTGSEVEYTVGCALCHANIIVAVIEKKVIIARIHIQTACRNGP